MKKPGLTATTRPKPVNADVTLRKQAENMVRDMPHEPMSAEDAKMLHELRVHQIELQMQNDELCDTREELELSRARYFDLYDLAPVGYLTISPQGVILETNLTAASMLGADKRELLNKEFQRFIYYEDRNNYHLHRTQLADCMTARNCELRFVRTDGSSPFWAYLQASVSEEGEYRVTLIDINDRKNDEKKLQESEERFRSLVMAATSGVVLQERSGKIITWNETAERIFGLSASQAIGLDATQYDWKTYREDGTPFPGAEHPSMQTFATGKPCISVVMKVVRDSGDFSWININTGPLFRAGESEPYAVVITFADITERKQAERILQARLRISEYAYNHSLAELLTKALDEAEAMTGSQIGFLYSFDADQRHLALQAWSTNTLTACNSERYDQHHSLDNAGVWADCVRERKALIHNDYASLPNCRGVPAGHAPLQREIVVPIFRNALVVAVMGVGNKAADYTTDDMIIIQHLANLVWDIVQRKGAEEELKVKSQQLEELNKSLEQRITATVSDLRRKDELLIQQGRLVAMGEMINNIAHQWRQPLNNIGLIVQSLQLAHKAGSLTAETLSKDVANTMQLLQQMSCTIDDFRNFFSMEKVLQMFSVNEAVRRSLNFMLPSIKNSNILVQVDGQADIQTEGYPGEYTQAMLNILSNAKDVLLEREVAEPCISINIFREDGRSVVTIADNGGGIPEEVMPKIFDPYFTTKGNRAGTGIGLFMSKTIIEKNMHGCLQVRNTENGAEFRIEL